jgi:hypothetical protein
MSDVELQNLLGFDQDDLAANRKGKLSPRQAKRIRNAQRLNSIIFAGAGIIAIVVAISVISTLTASQNDVGTRTARISLPAIGLGFIAWGSFKISTQKVDSTVRCVRGKVRFIKVTEIVSEKKPNGLWLYRSVEDYQLQIGSVIFDNVNRKMFDILEEQEIYTFYYSKDSKDILSAEYVAKGKQEWM